MNSKNILPGEPPHPVPPPMIYVKKKLVWEYQEIVRDAENGSLLTVEELNKLGADGWEMTGTIEHSPLVHYYFKRQIEK
jgi:hypothetical protein